MFLKFYKLSYLELFKKRMERVLKDLEKYKVLDKVSLIQTSSIVFEKQ